MADHPHARSQHLEVPSFQTPSHFPQGESDAYVADDRPVHYVMDPHTEKIRPSSPAHSDANSRTGLQTGAAKSRGYAPHPTAVASPSQTGSACLPKLEEDAGRCRCIIM
ncbi:hypothetical protein PsYK624_088180 [Phanerochaete sordida]|uniref:Uncharacterized protein n=1 Tax=Phanerochaete sordida TaxID=48140 RepID=A0A9P3GD27_9APHY|nr:hypothetical protein PsYK624_088180 [Phanerochaete sordida]